MCGGRLRFPFGNDGDDDVIVVATNARCLVCGFVLPPSATPICVRCDVAHVVTGTTARRAPTEPADPREVARVRDRLSSSPRARLIDAALARADVDVARVVAAAAFVDAEAAPSWTPRALPLPLSLARDVCEHLLLFRARMQDARTIAFTIVDGIEQSLLTESRDAGMLALFAAAGDHVFDLDLIDDDGDHRRPCYGECVLSSSSSATSVRLRPVLHLSATANLLHVVGMYLIGGRIKLAGFGKTLSLARPAVLSWLTRAVLLGAAGRAPTVAMSSALSSALAALALPDLDVEEALALLQLPQQRFPPQDRPR